VSLFIINMQLKTTNLS